MFRWYQGSLSTTVSRTILRATARVLVVIAVTCLTCASARAQSGPAVPDETIDGARRAAIIDSLSASLNKFYVFPDKAKNMESALRKKFKSGGYDSVTSARQFGEMLTKDLREICHDRHLSVRFFPEDQMVIDTMTDQQRQEMLADMRRRNLAS
ncbi:MAG: hypothetical protein AB1644_09135 [Candidatus Zixiibacteriota bacterium]